MTFGKIVACRQGNTVCVEHIWLHVHLESTGVGKVREEIRVFQLWKWMMKLLGKYFLRSFLLIFLARWIFVCQCMWPWTSNNVVFTNSIWNLMGFLSLVRTDGCHRKRGLTLELSAGSPSDGKHYFRMWPSLQYDYPHWEDVNTQRGNLKARAVSPEPLSDGPHAIQNSRINRWRAQQCSDINSSWAQSLYNRPARRLIRALDSTSGSFCRTNPQKL